MRRIKRCLKSPSWWSGFVLGLAIAAMVVLTATDCLGVAKAQVEYKTLEGWGEQRITSMAWHEGNLYAAGMSNRRVYQVRVRVGEMANPYLRSVAAFGEDESLLHLFVNAGSGGDLWLWTRHQTANSNARLRLYRINEGATVSFDISGSELRRAGLLG